jgi:hypothetical protein
MRPVNGIVQSKVYKRDPDPGRVIRVIDADNTFTEMHPDRRGDRRKAWIACDTCAFNDARVGACRLEDTICTADGLFLAAESMPPSEGEMP